MPTLGKEEERGLQEVLASGRIATGEEVEEFERAMATYLGLNGAAATSSGTAALHLTLLALGVKTGDEVIVPSFTCSALLNAVYHCGAAPTVVDVDEETMNISFAATQAAITDKTSAIIIPHMFGHSVENMEKFLSLGPPIVEDCAQSLGAAYQGRMTGTWGEAAIFSFYATKVITTGHGGMVISRNEGLLARVKDLREYDKKRDYRVRYNYCMTDLQGRMGQIQLQKLPSILIERRRRAQLYDKYLNGLKGTILPRGGGIYYRYVVRIKGEMLPMTMERLHQCGIGVQRPIFCPLHQYLNLDGFEASNKLYAETLSLPLYPRLQPDEVSYIARCLGRAVEDMNG